MTLYRDPSQLWEEMSSAPLSDSGHFSGDWKGGVILVNRDLNGLPVLIVEVTSEKPGETSSPEFEIEGLIIQVKELRIDDRYSICITFCPRARSDEDAFIRMSDLLVSDLMTLPDDSNDSDTSIVFNILSQWANFWKTLGTSPSKEKISGLIGELLVISDWHALAGRSHDNWSGPDGGQQDFRFDNFSVEVKVTQSRTGPRTHKISSVLQLDDPSTQKIFLISYRIKLNPNGSTNVFELRDQILNTPEFSNPKAVLKMNDAFTQVGLSKNLSKSFLCFDVIDVRCYEARDGFPKISNSSLPKTDEIFDVKYSIDLTGSDQFLVCDHPMPISELAK